jgi:predicted nucleotidyltransferase
MKKSISQNDKNPSMFTEEFRREVYESILNQSREDPSIISAAIIGSAAAGTKDRWSDIDLTFELTAGIKPGEVLSKWTNYLSEKFAGEMLLDLWLEETVYRVFLLPAYLQVDLSFSPNGKFYAVGPHFKLLYGQISEHRQIPELDADLYRSWIVHHLIRSYFCIQRNKLWQAHFWMNESRNYIMDLECNRNGFGSSHGRSYHLLNQELKAELEETLISKFSIGELSRKLQNLIQLFLKLEGHQLSENIHNELSKLLSLEIT